MTWLEIWFLGGGFLAGLKAGVKLAEWRWTANADQIQRIESGGNLYKVEHAR